MLSFREAKEKLGEPYSSLRLVTTTKHIVLNPKYIGQVSIGVKQQLDEQLYIYSQRFEGVLIAYSHLQYLKSNGTIMDDQPTIHLDIQGQFILFQPSVGSILQGIVNKIGYDHIGGLAHGHFNASVPKSQNTDSTDIGLGDEFTFQVTKYYHQGGVVFLKGNLITEITGTSRQKRKRSQSMSDTESPVARKQSKGMLGCISTPKPNSSVLPFNPGVSMVAGTPVSNGGSMGSDHTEDSGLGGALSPHSETPQFSHSVKKHKKKKTKHKRDDTEQSSKVKDEPDSLDRKSKSKKHKRDDTEQSVKVKDEPDSLDRKSKSKKHKRVDTEQSIKVKDEPDSLDSKSKSKKHKRDDTEQSSKVKDEPDSLDRKSKSKKHKRDDTEQSVKVKDEPDSLGKKSKSKKHKRDDTEQSSKVKDEPDSLDRNSKSKKHKKHKKHKGIDDS